MSVGAAVLIGIGFVWLGMVLAISFLEAPLKFRAPDITIPLGLGIGRIVFRALNTVELLFAIAVVATLAVDPPVTAAIATLALAVVTLAVQLAAVRPALTRRSDAILAGQAAPRSHSHLVYIGLELLKVAALIASGVLLLVHATP